MSDRVSSTVSYVWNGVCGVFGVAFTQISTISPDWWVVIITLLGTVTTSWINYHFKKKRFERDYKES